MSLAGPNTLVVQGSKDKCVSRALVPQGVKVPRRHESTSRALVLREAAWGRGELATTRKISGQDKLRLLAGEMMETAVRAPFSMEKFLKMAESQLGIHLDDISNLKDPEFFCDDLLSTINSRIESVPDKNGKRNPPLHDPAWVASVVGTRVHNAYTLAGSWRLIRNLLKELNDMGLRDADVRGQLRNNERMLAQYLVLYDIVTTLARLGQQRMANSAAATPHYAPYFVLKDKRGSMEAEMEFDCRGNNPRKIREAHKSYIDAIILELVLPDSQYPPYVLMSCLHNAVDDCRKEEMRFTQALWDSVGDLSVTIQALDLLESSLVGPEGDIWVQDSVHLKEQFTQFLNIQASSAQACTMVDSWKLFLRPPLTDMRKSHVLTQLWNEINKSYQQVSGMDIDTLWSLQTELGRAPQWSTFYFPTLPGNDDSDSRALTLHTSPKQYNNQPSGKTDERIMQGGELNSDDEDIPELISASDSSADGDDHSDFGTNDELSEEGYESDYDPDEDEWLQDMLQDALNAAVDDDLPEPPPLIFDAEEDKGTENPFKRMFSALKDRVFSANPMLKANEQSRRSLKPRPAGIPSLTTSPGEGSVLRGLPLEPSTVHVKPLQPNASRHPISEPLETEAKLPPLIPTGGASPHKSHQTTIEDVKDENDQYQSKKKKKKKKKAKKSQENSVLCPPATQPSEPTSSSPSKRNSTSPIKSSPRTTFVQSSLNSSEANFSRNALPFPSETTAQSARSYLHSENLIAEKTKVKSRPAFAGSFFKSKGNKKLASDGGGDGKGFLGHIRRFRFPKGAPDLLRRLISPASERTNAKPMKWEDFLKVMRLMGFSYDPSTAGSSVRFDPPDPKDQSISFHKPHPDSTLQRSHIRDFGKRLKKAYGWSPEQFENFVDEDDH